MHQRVSRASKNLFQEAFFRRLLRRHSQLLFKPPLPIQIKAHNLIYYTTKQSIPPVQLKAINTIRERVRT